MQTHPCEDIAPNCNGSIAMKENMVNGFIMIGTKHTTFLRIVSNNSFVKKCLPSRQFLEQQAPTKNANLRRDIILPHQLQRIYHAII
jgi:hypothetical protein